MGVLTKIHDLNVGMKNIDVRGKVDSKSDTMEVYSRFGNKVNRVTNAKITDESGSVKLILWNEQIDTVCVGDSVQIDNGHVTMFRGEKQLNVGKRTGKLSIVKKVSQS
ncbi:MAG: OB-fold nucleic acid binding domain-containing protein [Candidatus Bathyarchaeota archaeon]